MSDSPPDVGPALADGSYPAPPDGSYPAPPDASYPAPPDASYPAPDGGSYPAPDDGGGAVPVRPQPPPAPPRQTNRRAVGAAAAVGVVLVLGAVGVGVARSTASSGPGSSAGSTYQVPTSPPGRIDVTLVGGIDDHFVASPGGACGLIGMGSTGAKLLQVDTTNAARTIQFTIQVVPYQHPGTFVLGQTRIDGTVFYRPPSGQAQLLNARSGQVQVSSNGGKLGGRFDLELTGAAAAQSTHVTGTFGCG